MAPTYKESGKTIVRHSREDLAKLQSETDWSRVDGMTDEQLTANAASDPDSAPADIVWSPDSEISLDELLARQERRKQSVTIRLSAKTIAYFKKKGRGYQTKISALLDLIVEQEEAKERERYVGAFQAAKSAGRFITSKDATAKRTTKKSAAAAKK
ncbi:MAG: BrnA antitoxin family protein [Humidesulfovibrio sp.]|uniref:BrnA antitoxin family protein n=1 Tax=Humidesulfovibrio sp. TaxID=2910988 RepID=UPI002732FB20|nr:BrnA antitoxin family protein [Humidesulfovibrio sp.]MDP2846902.1 BrnA antitoxin family protein [Humidesulfovibrio sp.]